MSEFIINSEQLERMIEAIEHDTSRKINRLIIDGVRQTEIVRCRDCKWFDDRPNYQLCRRDMSCDEIAVFAEPDGFCAWAVRRGE